MIVIVFDWRIIIQIADQRSTKTKLTLNFLDIIRAYNHHALVIDLFQNHCSLFSERSRINLFH